MSSTLERSFDTYWNVLGTTEQPEQEYRFTKGRRWRFDRAWPKYKVAVELEGGVYSGGRHTRGKGYIADCDKYNSAALAGWLVLRFTGHHLEHDPAAVVAAVRTALEARHVLS
ncbi:MAG: hypothetical protein OHK0046_47340 [Anaerolineae bacterium]